MTARYGKCLHWHWLWKLRCSYYTLGALKRYGEYEYEGFDLKSIKKYLNFIAAPLVGLDAIINLFSRISLN